MLKGAIVGFGRMGIAHFAILNRHPQVEMVAVCDSSGLIASNVRKYSPVQVFTDYKEMLDKADLDFIVVCTFAASHAEIAREGIRRGLHIFMEKPLAISHKAGIDMVQDINDKGGIVNQVGYFLRFNEVFSAIRKCIADGLVGDVIHYENEMYGRTVIRPWKSSWRGQKSQGGGCVLEFASHVIDLSHFLFGPSTGVSGSSMHSIYSRSVDDAAYTTLHHRSGAEGFVKVNWSDETYRRPYNRVEVFGSKGKIIADRQEFKIYLKEADPSGTYQKGWNVRYLTDLADGTYFELRGSEYTNQLDHFVGCMAAGNTKTACTFEEAVLTDFVVERIFEDHENRRSQAN